ncbi:MAG: hypothetical protein U0L79_09800 [Lachnospiraceae bacterium]|nr:hypothetical protein [Lachnospiraceae bacterium]
MKKCVINIKKVVALVLSIILVFVNLPVGLVKVVGEESQDIETIDILVQVIGHDGNPVNNATFEVNDGYTITRNDEYIFVDPEGDTEGTVISCDFTDNITEQDITIVQESNYFPLTITKEQGAEELELIVYEQDNMQHSCVLDSVAVAGEYSAELQLYAKITNYIDKFDIKEGKYIIEKSYNVSEQKLSLQLESGVLCDIETSTNEATIDSNNNKYNLRFNKPGEVIVKITPEYDTDEFNVTYVNIKINNELKFSSDSIDTHDSSIQVTLKEGNIVDTVVKTITPNNREYRLNVTALYSQELEYSIELVEGTIDNFSINQVTGNVIANDVGTVRVIAECKATKAKASYLLKFVPTQEQLNVTFKETGKEYGTDVVNGQNLTLRVFDSFKLEVNNSDKYDIVRQIEGDSEVLNYNEDTETYTVNKSLDSGYVTIRLSARRANEGQYYDVQDFVVKVYPIKTDASADIIIIKDNVHIPISDDESTVITYIDNLDESDIDVNGKIYIDITADVESMFSHTQITDYIPYFSAEGLTFDGKYITNVEDIERNKDYKVKISITHNKIKTINKYFIFRLESTKTNNEDGEYYIVEGLHEGADGSLWKDNNVDKVIATGKVYMDGDVELYRYSVGSGDIYKEILEINTFDNGQYNREYKIFAFHSINLNTVTTRLYFGVDENNPEIKSVNCGEKSIVANGNIYSNDSVTLDISAYDYEDNLYSAQLFVGENQLGGDVRIVKDENGYGTCSIVINESNVSTLYEDVKIVVKDLANNTSDVFEVGTILIDKVEPSATINVLPGAGTHSFVDKENVEYYSENVIISINTSDVKEGLDNKLASGIESFDVYVDGAYYHITDNSTFEVPTNKQNGEVVISVKNIKDKAGNLNEEEVTKIIYIDKEAPTVTFDESNSSGKVNITSYGNFYNKKVTYIFDVEDNIVGINSAVVVIGSQKYNVSVSEGKLYVNIDLYSEGEVKLILSDYVNNEKEYILNTIKDNEGNIPFKSSYVMVEDTMPVIKFDNLRATDKGNWFNKEVGYTLNLSDVRNGVISSGIADVKITVNGVEYDKKSYKTNINTTDSYEVNINKAWIDSVIKEDGSYTIFIEVTDNAGNKNTDNRTVYIDTIAPVISDITGVVDGSVNTGVATVNVEIFEKHFSSIGNDVTVSVKKTLDGITTDYAVDKFISNSYKSSKTYVFGEDGAYTVVVKAEDAAGNKAIEKTITFVVDNTAPLADITGVVENSYYTEGRDVTLSVEESNFADMNVVISIERELNGEKTVINSQIFNKTGKNSSLTQNFSEEGTYTIKIDAVDAAGNVALTRTVIFTVDNTSPSISISGVENGAAYKGAFVPSIEITDNYFDGNYSVTLTKNGVKFDGSKFGVNSTKAVNVTKTYIDEFGNIENGVKSISNTFDMIQDNDGIYTLTVTAADKSGRISEKVINFSVNRFGSVYTFDENLIALIGSVKTEVTNDLKLIEYNANRLVEDSIDITITRDGALVDEVYVAKTEATTENMIGESGWYQYEYVISKENFKNDGLYVVTVSSKDEAGNNSENITYDSLSIRFSVDTTKPEVVKITGLSKTAYNANSITVSYEVFDAVGISEVRVFLNGNMIQSITDFGEDNTVYVGSFVVEEGMEQHISFQVIDIAGNAVDSDNLEDINSGKIVNFCDTVTVSTNILIRWYANKTVFYSSIAMVVVAIIGVTALIVFRKRRTR